MAPTTTDIESQHSKARLIEFDRMQKIVAYFEKSEPPQTVWAEISDDSEASTFLGARDFKKLTGFPAKKQEVFDLKSNKFVPIDYFSPRVKPPGSFYITKPAGFRVTTCFGLDDYIGDLKKIHAGNAAGKKRKLSPSDQEPSPRPGKRFVDPRNFELDQHGRTRVRRKSQRITVGTPVQRRPHPWVEIAVRPKSPGPSMWAETVATALNEAADKDTASFGEESDTVCEELESGSISSFEL
ncbi:hypothetical protein NP233_g8287 [Leucocoprinus birnbaumii]|uniref:Uncharacterized protein n=1 Tax=Leucocoprinus birnbaumii TaxID=56174 RepID=A0AAD5VQ80_9AGAR|nr:hypothetical protein NP233_g8287 [Leucocoprinus birnbaumii]